MSNPTLTLREYNGIQIPQRPDGYINATKMCQAGEKLWGDFWRLKSTKEYLAALDSVMGIPITVAVTAIQGGDPRLQGTWIHPRLASRLAQWISPEFAVIVDGWVINIMEGKQPTANQPTAPSLPSSEERLRTIRFGMDLLQELGGIDDRTRLALQDLTRNILLEDRLKQPALPGGERFEWNISDRLVHLGYRAKSGDLTRIGKVAAQLYRTRHGKNPPKREQYVGGTTRMVNCYSSNDLDILDDAISDVLGAVQQA
ncbi:MAG: KilA-N domain-containing protein [Leptolyngbya sp. SIO1E4]|nr:KilA-N domain-containing protein [Leptolyngbya sp. SIO1E4]